MSKGETALKLRDQDLLSLAEQVISQSHYEMIEQMDMKPLEADVSCIDPGSVACLFKILRGVLPDAFRMQAGEIGTVSGGGEQAEI